MDNNRESQEKLLIQHADAAFERLAKSGYAELDLVDRVLICVWSLEGEVNNGGFDQYYFNTSGDWAFDTPNALLAIGATHTAKIVRRANALFGNSGPSSDSTVRQQQLDALGESAQAELDSLDGEFYRYDDDLSTLLAAYVAKHKT
ncbi:DMP19 family protein [Rubinisphaera sp. JC750]|uniref:DMP19 family protein n=1 Tax=Rubinisphaera sp. JC750 TaxID=2898658 RepID=UPI001F1D5463|nr:DMP19 family protein [Rubinisphaera sp. JC750]